VVTAPNDEMLQSLRAGAPSDAFLDLVTTKVKQALRKVSPPNGATWTTEELEDVAGDLIRAKWRKISAVVWNMENDNQLRLDRRSVAGRWALRRATPPAPMW
jgi:hypothetical protein